MHNFFCIYRVRYSEQRMYMYIAHMFGIFVKFEDFFQVFKNFGRKFGFCVSFGMTYDRLMTTISRPGFIHNSKKIFE